MLLKFRILIQVYIAFFSFTAFAANSHQCIHSFSTMMKLNRSALSPIMGKSVTLQNGTPLKTADGKTRKYRIGKTPDIDKIQSFGNKEFFLMPIKGFSGNTISFDLLKITKEDTVVVGKNIQTRDIGNANIEIFEDGSAVIIEAIPFFSSHNQSTQIILSHDGRILRMQDESLTDISKQEMIYGSQKYIHRKTIKTNGHEVIVLSHTKETFDPSFMVSREDFLDSEPFDPITMPVYSSNVVVIFKDQDNHLIDIESVDTHFTQNSIETLLSQSRVSPPRSILTLKENNEYGDVINADTHFERIQNHLDPNLDSIKKRVLQTSSKPLDSKTFQLKSNSPSPMGITIEKYLLINSFKTGLRTYGFFISHPNAISNSVVLQQVSFEGEADIEELPSGLTITNKDNPNRNVTISFLNDKIIFLTE